MTTTFVLAVPRIVVGLLMAGHGLQKLAGWFGGSGLQGTADLLGNLHIRGASRWAVALALAETIGGVLMALRTGYPIVPVAIDGTLDVQPKTSFLIRPARVRVRVGRPIPAAEVAGKKAGEMADEVRRRVEQLRTADAAPAAAA